MLLLKFQKKRKAKEVQAISEKGIKNQDQKTEVKGEINYLIRYSFIVKTLVYLC